MTRLVKLQLIGPVAIFLVVLAADGAAAALDHWPSTEILWRANLDWFHAFQKSNYALNAYGTFEYSQFWSIAVPLLCTACFGFAFQRPLFLAIASNLSFAYASFVLSANYFYGQSWREASLAWMTGSPGPEFLVCFVLVAASFWSFVVSHLYYIRAIRGAVR